MSKAAKLLAKALNNPSKEEAVTAFGMAWSMAQREGVALRDLHTISEISADRERELVDKYNDLLASAKNLREEKEHWRRMYNHLRSGTGIDFEAAEKLRKLKNYIKRL